MGIEYQYAGLRNPRSPGLPVEQCSARLHCLAYAESRLMFLEAGPHHQHPSTGREGPAVPARSTRTASTPTGLRKRLTELRVSRRRAFEEPDPDLEVLFDEAMHSRGTAELLAALALVIKPAMVEAYRRYERETNGLADYASLRALREIVAEEEEGLALLRAAYGDAVESSARARSQADEWSAHLGQLLEAAGGIDGSGKKRPEDLRNRRGRSPYRVPRRKVWDDTFPKVWDVEHVGEERGSPAPRPDDLHPPRGAYHSRGPLLRALRDRGAALAVLHRRLAPHVGRDAPIPCSVRRPSRTCSGTAPPCLCGSGRPSTSTSSNHFPSTPCSATSSPA